MKTDNSPVSNTNNLVLKEAITNSVHVVTLNRQDFEVNFIALLKLISDVSSRNLTITQINLYTVEMYRDIARKWAWLRSGELRYALEQGAKGFYGPVFDISYTTIVSWINAYRDSDERRDVIMDLRRRPEIERTAKGAPVSPEELERSRNEYLKDMTQIAWDIFNNKLDGKVYHPDTFLFMLLPEEAFFYLEKTGKIKMTSEEKQKILDMVTKNCITYRKEDERAGMISQSLFYVDADRSTDFYRTCARKYCIARYFNFLITTKQKFTP